jgi:hypothetical protein
MRLSRSAYLLTVLAVSVASVAPCRNARAADNLYFQGGSMKNLVVDLVFWGAFTSNDMADVKAYLSDVCGYIDGAYDPPGFQPTVRYYGIWGCVPGNWIVDTHPIPPSVMPPGGTGALVNASFWAEASAAENGAFGASQDFFGNLDSAGLPAGPNRVAMVITKGTNIYLDTTSETILSHPEVCEGLHDYATYPFGATMFESLYPVFEHEIQEALTDPSISNGWVSSTGFDGLTHVEGADQCEGQDGSPVTWTSPTTGDNISGLNPFVLDPTFSSSISTDPDGRRSPTPADQCEFFEPEQYAPMAATFEYGGQGGSILELYYRQPNGQVAGLSWYAGQTVSGPPYDIGQPSSLVTAQGKPSVVYSLTAGGEYLFVRGSDNAVWVHRNGAWTSLGGAIYGDPSAVVWGGGSYVNVFALGTDDNIYTYGFINGGAGSGWASTVPGTVFSGSPKVIAKDGTSIDLFAVGENDHLEWTTFVMGVGFNPITDLGTMLGSPHHTPVGITSWAGNRLDILATTETSVGHRAWTGSWANDYDVRPGLGTSPSGSPAIVSWGSGRLDAFVITRQNQLLHGYFTGGTWYPDPKQPFASDATGDPITMSRGVNQLDVFYRTITGSLTHLSFGASGWSTEANILPDNSIQ